MIEPEPVHNQLEKARTAVLTLALLLPGLGVAPTCTGAAPGPGPRWARFLDTPSLRVRKAFQVPYATNARERENPCHRN